MPDCYVENSVLTVIPPIDPRIFANIVSSRRYVGIKTHEIGSAATVLAQSPKLLPLVETPGVHPITYLLDGALLEVQALRRAPVEAVAACSFFGGICTLNHERSIMGLAVTRRRLWRLFFCVSGK